MSITAYAPHGAAAEVRSLKTAFDTISIIKVEARRAAWVFPLAWIVGVAGTVIVGLSQPQPQPQAIPPLPLPMIATPSPELSKWPLDQRMELQSTGVVHMLSEPSFVAQIIDTQSGSRNDTTIMGVVGKGSSHTAHSLTKTIHRLFR